MILMGLLVMGVTGLWFYFEDRADRKNPPKRLFGYDYGYGVRAIEYAVAEGAIKLPPGRVEVHGPDGLAKLVLATTFAFVPQITAEPVVAVDEPDPVFFKDGEPRTFDEYDGQEHVLEYLRDAVDVAAQRGVLTLEPQVFLGMAGLGKTLLAKIVANELGERAEAVGEPRPRFFEWFPADIPNVERLDELMREVIENPECVVFIDEVHDLKESHNLKLYLVLEEGRYKFAGDMEPVKLPPFTLLAATTDWGQVHPALKRRWISHQLRPATEEQLLGYVMRRGFPIEEDAAREIVGRTKWSGAPWEALQLYRIAATTAEARGSDIVEPADVERVFQTQEIDRFGLRWQDRRIMEVLFTQPKYRIVKKEPVFVAYAASEQAVVTLAGIDRAEYRESVKPRLMARGLFQVRASYGQALTPRAEEWYRELRDVQVATG